MQSNGAGLWKQSIAVSIAIDDSERAAAILAVMPSETLCSDRVNLVWDRLSARCGDDEDIVFELSRLLDTTGIEWEVDWARSAW